MLDSVHDISYRCCHSLVTTHPPSNTKILMHSCAKILLQICILCNLCRIYFYLLFMPLSFEWGYYYWLQLSKLDWGKQALCKFHSRSARNSRSILPTSFYFLSWSWLKYLALFTNSTWKITVFIKSFGLIFTCHYQDIFILKWVVKVLVLGNLYQHQMKSEVKTKWIRTKLLFSVWSTHIFSAHQSRKT